MPVPQPSNILIVVLSLLWVLQFFEHQMKVQDPFPNQTKNNICAYLHALINLYVNLNDLYIKFHKLLTFPYIKDQKEAMNYSLKLSMGHVDKIYIFQIAQTLKKFIAYLECKTKMLLNMVVRKIWQER